MRTRKILWMLLFSSISILFNSSVVGADKLEAGAKFSDCKECPEMIILPAGEFMMGSDKVESGHTDEKPQHTVKIKSFAVSRLETSFAQWDACVADGKCPKADDAGFGRGDLPAVNISWTEAKAYAVWLSAKTGKNY